MRIPAALIAAAFLTIPAAAPAALSVGTRAPDFTTEGALAGHPFHFHLAEQLRRGPIVLYFYPRSFTPGCTLEAHAFSEAAAQFRASGVQIIGMSADDYPTLARFSVEECHNAFPVATATPSTIAAYDVRLRPELPMTSRTSYVIAPDGRILYAFSDLDWHNHVANTMAAVRDWEAHHRRR